MFYGCFFGNRGSRRNTTPRRYSHDSPRRGPQLARQYPYCCRVTRRTIKVSLARLLSIVDGSAGGGSSPPRLSHTLAAATLPTRRVNINSYDSRAPSVLRTGPMVQERQLCYGCSSTNNHRIVQTAIRNFKTIDLSLTRTQAKKLALCLNRFVGKAGLAL